MEKKITLHEFWTSKDHLAIHCDIEEKANNLLKFFDKLGKKWISKYSYLEINHWAIYEEYTCYDNKKGYCHIDWYKQKSYKIYEFDEVDLDN